MAKPLTRTFTKHPHQEGMTYLTHAVFATKIAAGLIIAACKGTVHAVFPFWFQTSMSDHIRNVATQLER